MIHLMFYLASIFYEGLVITTPKKSKTQKQTEKTNKKMKNKSCHTLEKHKLEY